MGLKSILENLPEVKAPAEKRLGFNVKLKWTLIMLTSYFVLANIPLFGLAGNSLSRFEFLSIILGTQFGSVISLGIGPIVMASIILQLLVGSKMLAIDMQSPEGKKTFQGLQKILIIFFCIFEATIYVIMRGLEAQPGFTSILILQLFLGGILIMFMDEVISKWGFGSGVSLFIAAGVGWQLFTTAFGFIGPQNTISAVGRVWTFFISVAAGDTINAAVAATAILATILVFLVVVWAQAIKVEIPLSFGRVRGFGMKWPLSLMYTSNIPVILTAALLANIQLFSSLLENWLGWSSSAIIGIVSPPNIVENIIRGSLTGTMIFQSIIYMTLMVAGSIMFAVFWVKTSGMDAGSVAKQILSSGLQIPGFRRDPRVLEVVLNRYIMPLTIMGGAAVGLLAAAADLVGALVRGTGLLLGVMIVYRLYEDIAQQHAYDMYPALRKIMVK